MCCSTGPITLSWTSWALPEWVEVYFLTSRHPCLGFMHAYATPCLDSALHAGAYALHRQPAAQLMHTLLLYSIPHHAIFHLNRARHMHTHIYFFPPLLAKPTCLALLFALLLHISQYTTSNL